MQSKIWSIRYILFLDVKGSNNDKPKDIGRDTPDKQGDNCLQPASEPTISVQFESSLEILFECLFGYFFWKLQLEISFGSFVWKFCLDVCLDISFGNYS